LKREHHSEEAI